MTVDLLCRVVDNLGDIGFVYRLARSLSELSSEVSAELRLRLIVDDLASFAALCPGVNPSSPSQTVNGWRIVRWQSPGEAAIRHFLEERPRTVIECYACGRPVWFEPILFDEADPSERLLIDLEYFTLEPWSADYHLLPSLTRSPKVKKVIFMPGILPGTGGLLQDAPFMAALSEASAPASCVAPGARETMRRDLLRHAQISQALPPATDSPGSPPLFRLEAAYWVLIFSYEHDYSTIVADLAAFALERPVLVFAAAGRSSEPFLASWNHADRPFPVIPLPLLGQTLWDRLLAATDFAIIRGEESFSRAILSGRPFLWECYPFTEADGKTAGHLEKIHAFLDLLRPLAEPQAFTAYERLVLRFNRAEQPHEPLPDDLLQVLRSRELPPIFHKLAQKALEQGNLAVNLMTFMGISR